MTALKLFRAICKNLEAIGLYVPSSSNQSRTLNCKNVFYFSSQMGMVILVTGFLIFKATSAYEYSVSFYLSIALTITAIDYVILNNKTGSTVKMFGKNEKLIKNREPF